MNEFTAGFNPTLRISSKVVFAALIALGWVLAVLSQSLPEPLRVKMEVLAVLTAALSALAWALDQRDTRLGRWFIISALVGLVLAAHYWLHLPGALAWLSVPVILGATLLGPAAAVGTACGEAALLLLISVWGHGSGTTAEREAISVTLGATFTLLGIFYIMHHSISQTIGYSEAYFERAQVLLEQARNRKAELEQALVDLANANRQLALAGERMATLRTIAEEAQKAKTMFVAKVSHEFRTPLNMIIGLVSLMVETPEMYDVVLPPEMRSDLEVVYRNCVHLAGMINDVLSLTQMEAGRLVLHRERVDLRQLIDNAATAVRPLVEKKGLFLRIELPDGLPQVYCDATRIQQVILNLVSNAARFTMQGGITVQVEHDEQHVVVCVTDTGPGIPPEDLEMIFEPFCQGSRDIWRDKGGTGLGLSISRQFVQLHGGRMWVKSTLGVGSSFLFELPISPPVGHAVRPGHQIMEDWILRERAFRTDQAGVAEGSAKPRLVVCDETGAVYSQLFGYADQVEFVAANDLSRALEALRQCPAHALVLNAATPDTLWSRIEEARAQVPDTPIVGYSVPQPVARAIEAGAVGYLTKPVTRAQLEEAIRKLGKPVRKVLVVDDDPDALRLFTRMLRACDSTLSVATASDGEQALEAIRDAPPDLILLDVIMPKMNGWQVLERLRSEEGVAGMSVLLVSAQDLIEQPPESPLLVAALGEGLSLNRLLRCSVALSELLLAPEDAPGPEHSRTAVALPA
ncbi:MAG: ATP-binding protein [Anaerolineae bacterium]|nr:ATP-binding protein [Anaerolineae bacterium]